MSLDLYSKVQEVVRTECLSGEQERRNKKKAGDYINYIKLYYIVLYIYII